MEQINSKNDTQILGKSQDKAFIQVGEKEFVCHCCGVALSVDFFPDGTPVLSLRYDSELQRKAAAILEDRAAALQ